MLTVSGSPSGQLLHPSPPVPSVKSTRRERGSGLRSTTAVSERRSSILDHVVARMLDPIQMGFGSPLEGAGPSASSLFPLGRTRKTLRGIRRSAKFRLHPGRVAREAAVSRRVSLRDALLNRLAGHRGQRSPTPTITTAQRKTRPARVFLPRRSTARPPASAAPARVAFSSSILALLR